MDEDPHMDAGRLTELFAALAERRVDYAVFGAVALGLHGLGRSTLDLDVFLRPSPANVDRAREALRAVFSDPDVDEISSNELCGDYPVVRYSPTEDFTVDLVTRVGESFAYDDLDIEEMPFDRTTVRVVSAPHALADEEGHLA